MFYFPEYYIRPILSFVPTAAACHLVVRAIAKTRTIPTGTSLFIRIIPYNLYILAFIHEPLADRTGVTFFISGFHGSLPFEFHFLIHSDDTPPAQTLDEVLYVQCLLIVTVLFDLDTRFAVALDLHVLRIQPRIGRHLHFRSRRCPRNRIEFIEGMTGYPNQLPDQFVFVLLSFDGLDLRFGDLIVRHAVIWGQDVHRSICFRRSAASPKHADSRTFCRGLRSSQSGIR